MAVLLTGNGPIPNRNRINFVDYIQSNGTQYIDTAYKATSENYRIKCRFMVPTIVDNSVLFGGGASTDIISQLIRNSSILHPYVGAGSVSAADVNFAQGVWYELECHANNGTFTVTLDGVVYSGNYSGSINKDYSLFLFANNVSGTASQHSKVCYSMFQIYDNDTLVRDFWPCYDPNSVGCLYDKVSKEYYYNAGTGEFTVG